MKVNKIIKVRIYPKKKEDIILLEKHFGTNRFIYNYFLDILKKCKEENLFFNYGEQVKKLVELKKDVETSWLKEVNSQSLQQTIKNLEIAKANFFKKKSGFPKFKKKGKSRDSFKVPQHFKFDIENKTIKIPKFKHEWKWSGKWSGQLIKINYITIVKSSSCKYYAAIQGEFDIDEKPYTENAIGVDLGLKNLCIDSNGNVIKNPKFLQSKLKKLKYIQRQHSRKKKGLKTREKWRKKLSIVHEKVRFQRENYLHQVSNKLINENQVISIETLSVKNLIKNKKLSKSIHDVAWGTLIHNLKYKSDWYNRKLVLIDRFYPSSKTCSNCKYLLEELPLNVRMWKCPSCKEIHDRDINAAKNILNEGLNILSGCGTQSDINQKQVEASSIEESMKLEICTCK